MKWSTLVILVLLCVNSLGDSSRTPVEIRTKWALPYYRFPDNGRAKAQSSALGASAVNNAVLVNPFFTPASFSIPALDQNTSAVGYAFWNAYRRAVGVSDLAVSSTLERSASAHANYVTLNNSYSVEGHYETEGHPGFTGVDPCVREKAAGYTEFCLGEEGNARLFAYQNILGLVDGPYHRFGMLGNYFQEVGIGGVGLSAWFIDEGKYAPSDIAENNLIVYPFPGQPNSPRAWAVYESPSPMPDVRDGTVTGYPITIQARTSGVLEISDFHLTTDGGIPVAGRPIADYANTRTPLGRSFIWIPKRPLGASKTYHVDVVGAVSGRPVVLSWDFHTEDMSAFTVAKSSATLSQNSSVTVDVATNNPLSIFETTYYLFAGVSVANPSPFKLVFTRANQACFCRIAITVQDENRLDAPTTVVLDLPN